jgi:hypothetical protein
MKQTGWQVPDAGADEMVGVVVHVAVLAKAELKAGIPDQKAL